MMAMKLKLMCLGLGVLKLEGAGAKLLGRATLRWLTTLLKNDEILFKPQFSGVKFNADFKNEK